LLAALPAEARTNDLDGAVATAEFFVELYGTMLQTGDTRLWDALSGPDCEFCQDGSQTAAGYLADGTEVTGGVVTVDRARTLSKLADDAFTYVSVVVDQSPIVTTLPDSTAHQVTGEIRTGLILKLGYQGNVWSVTGVQVVDPEHVS